MTQTALIVGASRGIGLGLVGEFERRGWQVIGTARDPAKAEALNELASNSGGRVTVEAVDTMDLEQGKALRKRLDGELLDLIIVNAGVGGPPGKGPLNVTQAEFDTLFLTNSLAPVQLAELFIDRVRPRSGVIGLMTSQLGSVEGASGGNYELYRASKAALNSFTRSFAAKHRGQGVAVLSLHPGWVKTDMGGPQAPLDVATSVKGLADVVERAQKDRKDGFFDYKGDTLPW
jgi:NAD(P)-dependent dehydrogenase (short-subunit alcohol dehydrogenase family)